jgi:hypothetical protein
MYSMRCLKNIKCHETFPLSLNSKPGHVCSSFLDHVCGHVEIPFLPWLIHLGMKPSISFLSRSWRPCRNPFPSCLIHALIPFFSSSWRPCRNNPFPSWLIHAIYEGSNLFSIPFLPRSFMPYMKALIYSLSHISGHEAFNFFPSSLMAMQGSISLPS